MHAIILCGGFGIRFPMSPEKPKALLEIRGKPLVEHLVDKLKDVTEIEGIHISTNSRFADDFRDWISRCNNQLVELVVEDANSNEEKLGAIGALAYVIEKKQIKGDFIVLNGDNVFDDGLVGIAEAFRKWGSLVIGTHEARSLEDARLFGVVQTDNSGAVVSFDEKPKMPKTTMVSTGVYFFPARVAAMISEYISSGMSPDAPGSFIQWLLNKEKVKAFLLKGKWIDVGNREAYELAKKWFR